MSAESYEFGDVEVDLHRLQVRRAGEIVPVEPKAFDVLRFLIANRDRLVGKDELLDLFWKDTFVTPNVLTRAIAQLRKALGDDAFGARYIETVAKRGYRFIAPIVICRNPIPESGIPVPKRLTISVHSHAFPAVSPDGRFVAYASGQTGAMEIRLTTLTFGSRELIVTDDAGQNVHPAFSPDGQCLAYHSRKRGGIWVIPAIGGAPRRVASFGSMPSWSPDNETIVFTSDAGGMSSQALLLTVRRDGSQLRELTRLGDPPGGHLAPRWSHDGGLIAFRVGRDAQSDVWIVDAAGGAPRRLAAEAPPSIPRFSPDDRPSAPEFSGDDSAVYWIGSTADGNDCLKRLVLGRDASPETVLPFVGKSGGGFSIAPDETVVLSLSDGSTNLFTVDVDSSGAAGPPAALTADPVRSMLPDVGSTGRVVYEQQVVGHPITPWVMDENGANKEPLTVGLPVSVQAPQWDVDGHRVFAVVSEPGSLQSSFGWIDIATRQLITIPLPSSIIEHPPHLSPNDQAIAFHRTAADGVMNVWVQRLDTGTLTQVTFDREAMTYPRWSQDGHWLAMVIKRGDKTHVGIVSAAGGEVQQLTHEDGQSWPHSFSPDDERIAFAGERQGVWNIYTLSRRTGELTQLTSFNTTDGYVRYPAWSPRGNRIVFERWERKGSLWLLKLPS